MAHLDDMDSSLCDGLHAPRQSRFGNKSKHDRVVNRRCSDESLYAVPYPGRNRSILFCFLESISGRSHAEQGRVEVNYSRLLEYLISSTGRAAVLMKTYRM
ncbi:hypothetical protein TREES_T100011687 [Tupaia chinensis]|uniref:Uncharacterized protein n=1 Tax=Tupaia chinensis TaxID=246437 RepID=L9L143_TUPCH|nr:hypothetical protein TREES_T100011687 [Tupaia chinensis]